MDRHLAEESEVAQEESIGRHSCRRTMAVDDAMMKALTIILMKRYPTKEGSQEYNLENVDDLIWVIANYIWKMVDNILAWLKKTKIEQLRLMYEGVEPAIGRKKSMKPWDKIAKSFGIDSLLPIHVDSDDDYQVWQDYLLNVSMR